jgi:hypothetical protein
VARNKLGGSGQAAVWHVLVDPTSPAKPTAAPTPAQETRIAKVARHNALATPSSPSPLPANASHCDRPQAHSVGKARRERAYEYAR